MHAGSGFNEFSMPKGWENKKLRKQTENGTQSAFQFAFQSAFQLAVNFAVYLDFHCQKATLT